MIKSFLFTLFVILTSLNYVSGQTKAETIIWINSKFPNKDVLAEDRWGNREIAVDKINNDGSFIRKYSLHLKTGGGYTYIFTGKLKEVNPSAITIEKDDLDNRLFYIRVYCSGSKECIKQQAEEDPREKFELDNVRFGPFRYGEANLDNRLLKAFKHLVTTLGGKKEAF